MVYSELMFVFQKEGAEMSYIKPDFSEVKNDSKITDDFWDLGSPREKKYEKPDFSGHTVDTTDITDDRISTDGQPTSAGEKILPREEYRENKTEVKTISSSFWIEPLGGGRINTSSYKRHSGMKKPKTAADAQSPRRTVGNTVAEYKIENKLIKKLEIRTWESETEFYGRFTSDALLSHRAKPSYKVDAKVTPVPYFSYVPQYAHMNSEQIEYYRYVRENIRMGRTVECDLPYLQLYIFEIINLADEIKADEGLCLLSRIWLGYRKKYPRLDGYLCEWLPDYCMINGMALPVELEPILAEITPKAQFKEFFLDSVIEKNSDSLGLIVAEIASDYDYKSSRYYTDNKEAYDGHIPAALSRTVRRLISEKRGVFSLDRLYKMTRDSYCGAIVSSGKKRRIDIEFCSFTRRADVRAAVTAMVKYTENKVRKLVGIKAKLNVDISDAYVSTVIDGYFAPIMPAHVSAEDKYMPEDYLRNYDAEDTGFDLDRAAMIEKQSWTNTERLTGDDFTSDNSFEADETETHIDGEMSSHEDYLIYDDKNETAQNEKIERVPEETDRIIREALRAALDGTFGEYCRFAGVFEGDIADRVNTAMLDVIGDVALESDGNGYKLIEDYREEIKEWL